MVLPSQTLTGDTRAAPAAHSVDLRKTYGAGQAVVHALAGITVTFERGRFTAVMGPSGSGKSTLMHGMAGLDRPTSGQSFVGDLDIGRLDDAGLTKLRRDRIGFVFQSFNLIPTLTAAENITLPAALAGTKVDREWFDYLVKQLGVGDRLAHRPVLVGLAVGVGVTVVAAIGPARNAVRIPPVAALDGRQSDRDVSLRRRFAWGTALAGAVMLAIGLAKPAIELVGVGAVCIFVGAATLAPAVARPLSSVIGRPLARLLGVSGKLGRENSMRSPRRTAQTASALMVGLALVAAMSVFGASLSRSATSSVDDAISADLILSANGSGQLSQSVPATASAVPGVTATTTVYRSQFEFQNTLATLTAVSTQHLAGTLILRMTAGTPAALARGELLMDSTTAKSKHLSVGGTVPVRFARTGSSVLRVGGIYQANALIGSYLVSAAFFVSHFSNPSLAALLLRTNGSGAVDKAVTSALAPYPNLQVQTRAQFEQAQTASVNQLLGLVYALLGLAVLIALIGIVNTLMLSVFERTREIGLLRAVGMKRRQVRAMIRSEAVILAIFGAIIGIIIGTGMGIALVSQAV